MHTGLESTNMFLDHIKFVLWLSDPQTNFKLKSVCDVRCLLIDTKILS